MAIEAARNYGVRPACIAGGTVLGGVVGAKSLAYLSAIACFKVIDIVETNKNGKNLVRVSLPFSRMLLWTFRTVTVISIVGGAAGAVGGAFAGNNAADRILK